MKSMKLIPNICMIASPKIWNQTMQICFCDISTLLQSHLLAYEVIQ